MLFDSGLGDALGRSALGVVGAGSVWAITAAAIAVGIALSETTSNTASANIVVPVMISLAQAAGVSPVAPALGAVFGASFGFILPVPTRPNAIAYDSGFVSLRDMARTGVVVDVVGFAVIWVGLRLLLPLLGVAR